MSWFHPSLVYHHRSWLLLVVISNNVYKSCIHPSLLLYISSISLSSFNLWNGWMGGLGVLYIMAWVVCLLMGMGGLVVGGLGTEMVK
jgi:hypothetical protein